jgi:hypothetical protein
MIECSAFTWQKGENEGEGGEGGDEKTGHDGLNIIPAWRR